MAAPIDDIVRRLNQRRQKLRRMVDAQAHPTVVTQTRAAFDSLGAMLDGLQEAAPLLTRQLLEQKATLLRQADEEERQREDDRAEAARLRKTADEEDDEEHAALLDVLARSYERSAERTGSADWQWQMWLTGSALTLRHLRQAADEVASYRDAEAQRSLARTAAGQVGKWALKLTPVRHEDLQDFKDAWEMLKKFTEPGEDVVSTLEAAGLRHAQAKAASSLFGHLDMLAGVALEWCRQLQNEPFVASAMGSSGATPAAREAALQARLQRAAADWT